ncbi:leader peptidase (prepilin peptidase)/N-methyltransferase [Archangium gephyra]|uniref:Prepilin leader peptidase/N-methyltransferase n=2 Tax=Archangium gephyra TaxID=48 RepID=A0ABX9K2B2_9BACT|nr:leader peptidase (prepilin peptidase)/N-methyltransferase [Archangium gephyra]
MTPQAVEGAAVTLVFVMGLLFGSFLNVVIARVPAGESIVHPRSRCPRCGHQLAWYENIPVLSWLALRARCSSCALPISWRYPLIELLTALLFLACQRRFGWTPELVAALVMVLLLVPLSFIDLEHWILPHELTWPGIAAGVVLSAPMGLGRVRDSIIGAVVGFLIFWGMEWLGEKIFKKEALGAGDKDLLALIGAFLTWKPLLAVIFLSSLQGALVGSLLLLVRGRAGPAPEPEPGSTPPPPPATAAGTEPSEADGPGPVPRPVGPEDEEEEDDWEPGPTSIPFGPWLSLAALEVMLLGPLLREVLPVPLDMLFAGAR